MKNNHTKKITPSQKQPTKPSQTIVIGQHKGVDVYLTKSGALDYFKCKKCGLSSPSISDFHNNPCNKDDSSDGSEDDDFDLKFN